MTARFFLQVLIALSVMVGASMYVGVRLLGPFLGFSTWVVVGALLFPFFLMTSVVSRQVLKRRAPDVDVFSWIVYVSMGAAAFLLVGTVLRDVALGVGYAVAWAFDLVGRPIWPDEGTGQLIAQASAGAVLGLSALATAVGLYEARRRPAVQRVDVPVPDLPEALEGFSIAQLSDVHIGPTLKRGFLQRVVEATSALGADVVAITGDLIDGQVKDLAPHVAPLADLAARHGVYFVTGNHEYYSGADAWIAHVQSLGIDVLQNEHRVLEHDGAQVVLGGVHDYSAAHVHRAHRSDPGAAFAGAPDDAPRVLLAHQPRSAEAAAAEAVTLMLSGHTHGGQFFPWNFFVPLQQPFVAGLHELGATKVWVSRGTGYWGPPIRLFAPSEISLLRLVRA